MGMTPWIIAGVGYALAGFLLWRLLKAKKELGAALHRNATLKANYDECKNQLNAYAARRAGDGLAELD